LPNVLTIEGWAFFRNQITKLSLPNVRMIENITFWENNITELSLPNVRTIGNYTFWDNNIMELSLPNVRTIKYGAFSHNPLKQLTLGTAFTEPTEIELPAGGLYDESAFSYVATEECDLILGEFVLPERDGNMWNGYTWKSITVLGIKEEAITNISLAPNPTDASTTLSFDLDVAGNLTITLTDLLGAELFELHNEFTAAGTFTKTFSLENILTGSYFLKINHNGNISYEKIIKE